MQALLTIIGLLLGALGYNFLKRKSAEALNQNNETKSKLNEQDKGKAQNDGLLSAEEEWRKQMERDAEKHKNEPVNPKDF